MTISHKLRCPFCHDSLASERPRHGCEACLAWHHRDCFEEHGRCASCGQEGESLQDAIRATLEGSCVVLGCHREQLVRGQCEAHAAGEVRMRRIFAVMGALGALAFAGIGALVVAARLPDWQEAGVAFAICALLMAALAWAMRRAHRSLADLVEGTISQRGDERIPDRGPERRERASLPRGKLRL